MERRYAPLRPEPYPAEYQAEVVGLIDAPVAKKSRVNVSTACNACRKRKTRVCPSLIFWALNLSFLRRSEKRLV